MEEGGNRYLLFGYLVLVGFLVFVELLELVFWREGFSGYSILFWFF